MTALYNHIMFWLMDSLLDDWNMPHWDKQTATQVGFNLAFIMRFAHNDDQSTLASKSLFSF